jgi:hypothetical protein
LQVLVDGFVKTVRLLDAGGSVIVLAQRARGRRGDVAAAGVAAAIASVGGQEPQPQRALIVEVFAVPSPKRTLHPQPTVDELLAALASGLPPKGSRAYDVDQLMHVSQHIVTAMSGTVTLENVAGGITRLAITVPYTEPTDAEIEV